MNGGSDVTERTVQQANATADAALKRLQIGLAAEHAIREQVAAFHGQEAMYRSEPPGCDHPVCRWFWSP